jgi:hypothetical protein
MCNLQILNGVEKFDSHRLHQLIAMNDLHNFTLVHRRRPAFAHRISTIYKRVTSEQPTIHFLTGSRTTTQCEAGLRPLAGASHPLDERIGLISPFEIPGLSVAKKLGLGTNAIGARFWREDTPSSPEQLNRIVGLVKDTKYHGIRRPTEPIAYLALAQDKETENTMQVLIRSRLPPQERHRPVEV